MSKHIDLPMEERELRSMTTDLEDQHQETFAPLARSLGLREQISGYGTSRRWVLGSGAALFGGALLAACGGDKDATGAASGASPSATAGSSYDGDLKYAALNAAVSNLGVAAYGLALEAAGQNKIGTVPPAVSNYINAAKGQHADHAMAFNAILTKAGATTITETPLTVAAGAVQKLQAATNVNAVATVAQGFENSVAATRLLTMAQASDKDLLATSSTTLPTVTQHAMVLNFVLGEYPVPAVFLKLDQAIPLDAFTG